MTSIMVKAESLKAIPLFHGIPDTDLEKIAQCLREKSYSKGEFLFMAGASCERVFIVQSGSVKVFKTSALSGREQVLETLGRGQTCACHAGDEDESCASTGEALSDCRVWYFSPSDFTRLLNSTPSLSRALNHVFAGKLRCLSSLVEDVSLKDVRSRVVKFLLEWPRKNVSGNKNLEYVLDMTLTREEMAKRVGAARETVTRALHLLKDEDLIEILPHQIILKNKTLLENLIQP